MLLPKMKHVHQYALQCMQRNSSMNKVELDSRLTQGNLPSFPPIGSLCLGARPTNIAESDQTVEI